MQQVRKRKIKKLLKSSSEPYLAECLDLVPKTYLQALNKLIQVNKKTGYKKEITCNQVRNDVSYITAGYPQAATYSQPYL